MRFPIIHTICLLALSAPSTRGQEPPAAAAAEARFRNAADEAISPVTERYLTALTALARQLSRAGKTSDASEVTKEITRVQAAIDAGIHPLDALPGRSANLGDSAASKASESIPGAAQGDLFLTPDQADLSGSLAPDKRTRVLRGFYSEDDVATWTLEKFSPGTYDLILDFACPSPAPENPGGGSVMIIAGNAKTTVDISPEGGETSFRRQVVGGVTLDAPPVEISVGAVEKKGKTGIFRLRAVILRPR